MWWWAGPGPPKREGLSRGDQTNHIIAIANNQVITAVGGPEGQKQSGRHSNYLINRRSVAGRVLGLVHHCLTNKRKITQGACTSRHMCGGK